MLMDCHSSNPFERTLLVTVRLTAKKTAHPGGQLRVRLYDQRLLKLILNQGMQVSC